MDKIEVTKKSAMLKVILVMVVLVCGIGVGILISRKNTATINKTQKNEEKQETISAQTDDGNQETSSTQTDKNEQESKDETSVSEQEEKSIVENKKGTQENTTKVTESKEQEKLPNDKEEATVTGDDVIKSVYGNISMHKVLQLDGDFFGKELNIKEVDNITSKESTYVSGIDLDNDGEDEFIEIEPVLSESNFDEPLVDYFKLNIWSKEKKNTVKLHIGARFDALYVVDLDIKDKYKDVILLESGGNGFGTYYIYKFDGNTLKYSNEMMAHSNIYYNGNGKVASSLSKLMYYSDTEAIISDSYYDYATNKINKIDLSKASDELITFYDIYFTTDVSNEQKVFEGEYLLNSGDKEKDKKKLLEVDIYQYDEVQAYFLGVEEIDGRDRIKIKLQDGRVGYSIGPWAG